MRPLSENAASILAAGRDLNSCTLTHDHDEAMLVLDGEVEIRENGETRVLTAGQGALIPRNTPHAERFKAGARLLHIAPPEPHNRVPH